ncbi:hypothetical protein [Micromonospora sp. CA-248212]|uniref:hypothetical protein n=1 Tax=Micromonospora sp. CA-248212 TaxID=3239961 RepID=UPI003D93E69C
MALAAEDLDRVAQAARFTGIDGVRARLRRLIERIQQQGDRIAKSMDGGKSIDDYTQIVQEINDLTGEALTVAAQLDVLASIARTAKEAS